MGVEEMDRKATDRGAVAMRDLRMGVMRAADMMVVIVVIVADVAESAE
jgi:hypothetical protein